MAKKRSNSKSDKERDEILIENFVGLQKAMTNLASKFSDLSEQISSLLEIYEESAKKLAEKSPENQDLIERLDELLEQNKTIARGLVKMEERTREGSGRINPKPLPKS
ncbi:MAG: hypothetical protein ACP5D2_00295 [Candidatus Nanoarchaeia archaeon]